MTKLALTAVVLGIALTARPGAASAQDEAAPRDAVVEDASAAQVESEPAPLSPVASLTPLGDAAVTEAASLVAEQDGGSQRPVAIDYSDAHFTRAKIHKYASFATLPLLATELYLGESLYHDPQSLTSGKRTAHGIVGAGLIGLFGVNSVTGIWNLLDSREAPGHTKRLVHGLLMLTAEGGFVAAAVTAPGHSRNSLVNFDANAATHRNIALFSIGVGTAGYLLMLFSGGH